VRLLLLRKDAYSAMQPVIRSKHRWRTAGLGAAGATAALASAVVAGTVIAGPAKVDPPSAYLLPGPGVDQAKTAGALVIANELRQRSRTPAVSRFLGQARDGLRFYLITGTAIGGSKVPLCLVALHRSAAPAFKFCSDTGAVVHAPLANGRSVGNGRTEFTGLVRSGYTTLRVGSRRYVLRGSAFDVVVRRTDRTLVFTGSLPAYTMRVKPLW
jgi:hypothetical protein